MRAFLAVGFSLLSFSLSAAEPQDFVPKFFRGDVNADGLIEIVDTILVLQHLFLADPEVLECESAADANDDGSVDIGDPLRLLVYLFFQDTWLPEPHGCGEDPTPDRLTCVSFGLCGTPPQKTSISGIELVYIPPGWFVMGSPATESGRSSDETLHDVALTCGFYLSKFEITKRQWLDVMGKLPPNFSPDKVGSITTDKHPILAVGWFSAQEFCRRLSELEGTVYRLPTEAEWEYACRAGTQTRFSFGDAKDCPDNCSNKAACEEVARHMVSHCGAIDDDPFAILPVGSKLPNAWSFHDLHGNVGEWVSDWYGPYPSEVVFDPQGPRSGRDKVWRSPGAGWLGLHSDRSAARWHAEPSTNETTSSWALNISFRVVQATNCRPTPPD